MKRKHNTAKMTDSRMKHTAVMEMGVSDKTLLGNSNNYVTVSDKKSLSIPKTSVNSCPIVTEQSSSHNTRNRQNLKTPNKTAKGKQKKTKQVRTYFSLRSFDKANILRPKEKVTSKDDTLDTSSLQQKKKTPNKKTKPIPSESPPLDPTLPFVELDMDIVVDESTFPYGQIELPTLVSSSQSQKRKKRGLRRLNKSKQLSSTEPISPIPFVSEVVQSHLDTIRCDKTHTCCQKASISKSDMATQWEDPSHWYTAVETFTSTATHTDITPEQVALIQNIFNLSKPLLNTVEGNQHIQTSQEFKFMNLLKTISHAAHIIDSTPSENTNSTSMTSVLSSDQLPIAADEVCITLPSVPNSFDHETSILSSSPSVGRWFAQPEMEQIQSKISDIRHSECVVKPYVLRESHIVGNNSHNSADMISINLPNTSSINSVNTSSGFPEFSINTRSSRRAALTRSSSGGTVAQPENSVLLDQTTQEKNGNLENSVIIVIDDEDAVHDYPSDNDLVIIE